MAQVNRRIYSIADDIDNFLVKNNGGTYKINGIVSGDIEISGRKHFKLSKTFSVVDSTVTNNAIVLLSSNYTYYSNTGNGGSWIANALPSGSRSWEGIHYSSRLNIYVLVQSSGDSGHIWTSTDLINWTLRGGENYWLYDVAENDSFILVIGNSSVFKSYDGITFTRYHIDYVLFQSIAYSYPLNLFIIGQADRIRYSANGESWTVSNFVGDSTWNFSGWLNDRFICLSDNDSVNIEGRYTHSFNGVDWVFVLFNNIMTEDIITKKAIYANGTYFISAFEKGTNKGLYYISNNGNEWILINPGFLNCPFGTMEFFNGQIFIFGMFSSSDYLVMDANIYKEENIQIENMWATKVS